MRWNHWNLPAQDGYYRMIEVRIGDAFGGFERDFVTYDAVVWC